MLRTFMGQSVAWALPALVVALTPAFAAAQSQDVRFETVDKVELKGTYYPSSKANNKPPCVLLLPKLGGSRNQEGWDDLAKALSAAGFVVLSFDFRGHSDSTKVDPEIFWTHPFNARTFKTGKDSKDRINSTDFLKKNTFYLPMLVNDIEAAKDYLNLRNNASDCNASSTIVIGAEESAALGSLWVWHLFGKPRFVPNPFTGGFMPDQTGKTDGADIAACVWLSMPKDLNKIPVSRWLTGPSQRSGTIPIPEKVPMAFFYGDKDVNSTKAAAEFIRSLKSVARIPETTKAKPVKNSKAVGSDLLKASLGTSKEITDYLQAVMAKRGTVAWDKRAQIPLQLVQLSPYFNLQ